MALITLTGPTCSGKTSIEAELQKMGIGRAISHTTRSPRAGEVDGQHYHFVSEDEYSRLQAAGKFVEAIAFGSCRYAMSADAVESACQDSHNVVIVADPHGAEQLQAYCRAHGIESLPIWVDCDAREQARRWVMRLCSDLVIGKEVAGSYAERLSLMLTQEAAWREEAAMQLLEDLSHGAPLYQMRLDSTHATALNLALKILNRRRSTD